MFNNRQHDINDRKQRLDESIETEKKLEVQIKELQDLLETMKSRNEGEMRMIERLKLSENAIKTDAQIEKLLNEILRPAKNDMIQCYSTFKGHECCPHVEIANEINIDIVRPVLQTSLIQADPSVYEFSRAKAPIQFFYSLKDSRNELINGLKTITNENRVTFNNR